jgi:hypothetical protein
MAEGENNGTEALERLVAVLERLSAPPVEQESYLRSLGLCNADELALDFDDLLFAVTPVLRRLEHGRAAAEKLAKLDGELNAMSYPGRSGLWTFDALQTSPRWEAVRKLASEAKAALMEMT